MFLERIAGRGNSFDFLRYFLAVLVIFSHAYPQLGIDEQEPIRRLGMFDGGSIAVHGFFIISGFLITASWQRNPNVLTYAKKRALRIYPGLIAALLVCAFIISPLGGKPWNSLLRDKSTLLFLFKPLLLWQVSGMSGAFMTNPMPTNVIGSIWTIRFEILCYALVALFGSMRLFHRRAWILGLFLSLILCQYIFLLRLGTGNSIFTVVRLLTYFMAGSVFYLYADVIPYSRRLFWLSLTALLLIRGMAWNALMPLLGTYILLTVAFAHTLKAHHFGRYGDFSYGTYLYGFSAAQLVLYYFPSIHNPTVLFVFALAGASLMAVASWHLVEAPFLRRKASDRNTLTRMAADRERVPTPIVVEGVAGAAIRNDN